MLPHINGRKLAEIARDLRPNLKVLFVPGMQSTPDRGGFLGSGMDMLLKPFAPDALGAKVRSRIERSGIPRPVSRLGHYEKGPAQRGLFAVILPFISPRVCG